MAGPRLDIGSRHRDYHRAWCSGLGPPIGLPLADGVHRRGVSFGHPRLGVHWAGADSGGIGYLPYLPAGAGACVVQSQGELGSSGILRLVRPKRLELTAVGVLVVQAGIPGSELLLATIGVVVLASVIIHGAAATPFGAWDGLKAAEEILDEEREATVAGLLGQHESEVPRISIDELAELMVNPEPPMIIDGRARASYELDKAEIPGSIRCCPTKFRNGPPTARTISLWCLIAVEKMEQQAPVRRINSVGGESTPWPSKEDSTTGVPCIRMTQSARQPDLIRARVP